VIITLNPELEARLRDRADAEGLTIEAYIERIAREDERAEREVETLVIDALDSGESISVDDDYWDKKRNRLIDGYKPGSR
jgi:hypothetical protein